jgi:flagellar hook assembly protein FlgD
VLDESAKAAGVQRFSWDGTNADGSPAAEGQWRLSVSATDEGGQTTTADRFFWLDRTLGGLSVSPPLTRIGRGGRLTASFTLTRPARLTGTLRTRGGAVVATFTRAAQAQAGPNAIRWNGKVGKRWVPSGRYLVRIRAVSTVGASELQAPVTIRRVAPARAPKRG